MRDALLAVEEWQHRRRQDMAGAMCGPAQPAAGIAKMNEKSENVYENKGPLLKTRAEAGMLQKKRHLLADCCYVTKNKCSYHKATT